MGVAVNATHLTIISESVQTTPIFVTPSVSTTLSEREKMRIEFYQTYDVTTGIRIAATLGGFFGLMVLLVVYKSKCKSQPDENLEAAISAAVDAEEEEMEAAFSGARFLSRSSGARQSIGNMSVPIYTRFSSVGGDYRSLLTPSFRRYQYGSPTGRVSLPTWDISFRHHTTAPTPPSDQEIKSPHLSGSYYNEEDEIDFDDSSHSIRRYLQVPNRYRRLSSLTETSSDTVYFETTVSNVDQLPTVNVHHRNKCSTFLELSNPIDIQVIQPTPQISPSGSTSGMHDSNQMRSFCGFRDRDATENIFLHPQNLAPLGSICSSSAVSSESEMRSIGSDSVFIKTDLNEDTDEGPEELSNKSEPSDCTKKKYRIISLPTLKHFNSQANVETRHPNLETEKLNVNRRYSDSSAQMKTIKRKLKVAASIWSFPIFKKIGTVSYETRISELNTSNVSSSTSTISDNSTKISTRTNSRSLSSKTDSVSATSSSDYYSSASTLPTTGKKYSISRIAIIETTDSIGGTLENINQHVLTSLSCSKSCDHLTNSPLAKDNFKTHSLKTLTTKSYFPEETLF